MLTNYTEYFIYVGHRGYYRPHRYYGHSHGHGHGHRGHHHAGIYASFGHGRYIRFALLLFCIVNFSGSS